MVESRTMKPTVTIAIELDYKFPVVTNGNKQLSPQEATANYLEAAVASAHPQGLEGQQRRVWGRIQRTLDAALDSKATDIEIEQAGLEFLKKALKECKIPPSLSKYFIVLEDEIDRERA
jgi:hypothetical protein